MIPRWLVFSLLSLLFWGGWGVVPKALGPEVTAFQSQALSTIGLLPVILALTFSRSLRSGRNLRKGSLYAFAAGLLGGLGNIAYYHALSAGGKAAAVIPLTALYPLVTILLAMLFFNEKPSGVQLGGMGLALAAIFFFNVDPKAALLSTWLIYALLPIFLWGVAALLQKISTNYASSELSTVWFLAASIPIALLIILTRPMNWSITGRTWMLLLLLGFLLGLGNATVLLAYGSGGKASIVTPLSGLYPALSVPLAIGIFGETVTKWEWRGIVLSLAAIVALSWEKASAAARRPDLAAAERAPPEEIAGEK